MELSLLVAADRAADTPARRRLLEGLLEGSDREITRTLDEHPEHGDLLDDDFFWCFMGLGMARGDRSFWRAMQEWGYSLDSSVRHPDSPYPYTPESLLGRKAQEFTLAEWGIRFLPMDRLEWLEENGLLNPWRRGHTALSGLLYANREVADWLLEKWKQGPAAKMNDWQRKIPPEEMASLGKIAGLFKNPNTYPNLPHIQPPQELEYRYESFCELFLKNKHPDASTDLERKKAFVTHLGPTADAQEEFSQWLVKASPEAFSLSWPNTSLSTLQETWRWARALWEAGAPAGDESTPGVLFDKAVEIMVERGGDAHNLVHGALRAWTARASQAQVQELLEGSEGSSPSPLWRMVGQEQWKLAAVWMCLGARLDRPNAEGKTIGAMILARAMNRDMEPALQAWDAYRKRAVEQGVHPSGNPLWETKAKDLEWKIEEEDGESWAREAIMHGTLPPPGQGKPSLPKSRF